MATYADLYAGQGQGRADPMGWIRTLAVLQQLGNQQQNSLLGMGRMQMMKKQNDLAQRDFDLRKQKYLHELVQNQEEAKAKQRRHETASGDTKARIAGREKVTQIKARADAADDVRSKIAGGIGAWWKAREGDRTSARDTREGMYPGIMNDPMTGPRGAELVAGGALPDEVVQTIQGEMSDPSFGLQGGVEVGGMPENVLGDGGFTFGAGGNYLGMKAPASQPARLPRAPDEPGLWSSTRTLRGPAIQPATQPATQPAPTRATGIKPVPNVWERRRESKNKQKIDFEEQRYMAQMNGLMRLMETGTPEQKSFLETMMNLDPGTLTEQR